MNEENVTVLENTDEVNDAQEVLVPVKFNKQIQQLSVQQAASLAQKGMKFDMISDDYKRLGSLAAAKSMSVSDFIDSLEQTNRLTRRQQLIEQCGGNEEMADHVLSLECSTADMDNGLQELREFFPEMSIEKLPESVRYASELKGTKLLDEYLRYQLTERRKRSKNEKNCREAQAAGVGSQRQYGPKTDAANAEFLRGIWNK